ncbi:ribokinase [Kribbella speibonae]|uniref:Ribokinase n=1 Tax=Kribbella speibonae TaxID=1572660 RepID=A0ABY2AAU9_9ACTN|nr:ribokinase [Kribbella speibonae]TCC26827.1 ribokinase [Kribbella speibonae]
MTRPQLTVVGSINEDITAVGERLPSPGETVSTADVRHSPGGKGANQAAAAARLGADVRLVSARGNDAAGLRSLEALRKAGVDVSGVTVAGRPTGTALVVVDSSGENQIAVAPGANNEVQVTPAVRDAPAILCQLELPLEATFDAVERATGFVALNASPAGPVPTDVIDRCDLVVVNESEYAAMPALSKARLVVVTYGSDGAVALRTGRSVAYAQAPKVDVVSTVGAGDAFCAALVVGLLEGLPIPDALSTACAVGAATVQTRDAQPELKPLQYYQTAQARTAGR